MAPQNNLKFKTKALKGKQLLGEAAYKADIVFDREYILNLQLMRGHHLEMQKDLLVVLRAGVCT